MHSLRQQLLALVIGPMLLISIIGSVITGFYMKDRAILATGSKAESDLNTGETIIDLMYPGDWEVREGRLLKGGVVMNNNTDPVDKIAALTGDEVTIFLGDTRISTTVRDEKGNRAIGTKVSDEVASNVLKNGRIHLGEANVVGEIYQTAYKPIRDDNGKIVGMLFVGISQKLSHQLIDNPLITIGVASLIFTVVVGLTAWYFAQRVIIGPLRQITEGTREAAEGHLYNKVEVSSSTEINELARAYNQMLEGMQGFAQHISRSVGNAQDAHSPQVIKIDSERVVKTEELPKGLNDATMKQLLAFLESKDTALSAEDIGDGVNLTRVTARRYLDYLDKAGRVEVIQKYGTVGRPVKLYKKLSE